MTLALETPNAKPADHDPARADTRPALAALSLCTLLPSLGTSIANVALPTLAKAFDASFPAAQWVLLAYLLAITTATVGAGRLGDLVGRRRLLLAGIALFTAASLLCSAATTLPLLIAARAAQGLGAAVMMALTVALVRQTVPTARTGAAMGLLGSMSAIGTTLGPAAGGLLVASLGWPSIFLLNLPLGALAFLLTRRHLPQDPPIRSPQRQSFDHTGMLLIGLTLTAYSLSMTLGHGRVTTPLNATLLAIAAAGAALFTLAERRATSPLIPLTTLRDSSLTAGLAMNMLVSVVAMTTLVVGPFYLSQSLHLTTLHVGLAMSAGPVAAALAGAPAGRLTDRLGAPRATTLGLLTMTTASLALATLPTHLGLPAYLAPIVLLTTGYALFQAANNTSLMTNTPSHQRGLTSGLLNLSRYLGLITGAAAMGTLFRLASTAPDIPNTTPSQIATATHTTFAAATLLLLPALALSHNVQPASLTKEKNG